MGTKKTSKKTNAAKGNTKMRIAASLISEKLKLKSARPILVRAKKMELEMKEEICSEKHRRMMFIYATETKIRELFELCKGTKSRGDGSKKIAKAQLEKPQKDEMSMADAADLYGMSTSGFRKRSIKNNLAVFKRGIVLKNKNNTEQTHPIAYVNKKEMYELLGDPINTKNTVNMETLTSILS